MNIDKDIKNLFDTYVDKMDVKLENAKRNAHTFITVDVVTYENFRDLCVKMLEEMNNNDSKGSMSKLSK